MADHRPGHGTSTRWPCARKRPMRGDVSAMMASSAVLAIAAGKARHVDIDKDGREEGENGQNEDGHEGGIGGHRSLPEKVPGETRPVSEDRFLDLDQVASAVSAMRTQ